ncbi:class I glutamine amidotransferase-like protein [Cokeromyces recurvatus]|uniref:class I glutamine amidotransferase-like protein n=1 Tax=Cokeromyces recurvatus TaxID=90255 RepID=UPI00221F6836|nr:class I glutamine amidotransferase-like protein [Cokeromyces recurvatus]KAI7903510.1 class I glutamine amidotransferase-like protein [Cokeromyces recurvatus]
MPEVLEKVGDYLQQFQTAFKKAADNEKVTITWDAFDVVDAQEYPSLQDIENGTYDALILTGSKYNSYDNDPWLLKLIDFIKKMETDYTDKVKLVGVCFGHQIIIRAAGGKTAKSTTGWEVCNREFIKINQSHQDIITDVPEGYKTLGYTKDRTPVQISVSENKQCICIQGHPEYSRVAMMILIKARMKAGVIEKDLAEKVLYELENSYKDVDDVWFTEKVLDFILNKL